MKRFAITLSMALFGMLAVQAQGNFSAGLSGGIPIGDAGDFATFAIAVDLGYLFEISDDFEAGPVTGYSHSFGDSETLDLGTLGMVEIDYDDAQFIPIGGRAKWNFADSFSLAGDIGYAIGVNSGNDGGFYYSPRLAYGVTEALDIVAAYRGVTRSGGSWDIISLGVDYTFGQGSSEE